MVNKENVRKWVDALRSGDYKQTTGILERVNRYDDSRTHCCLGVACRVFMKEEDNEGILTAISDRHITKFTWHENEEGEADTLPEPVSVWLGINSNNPVLLTGEDGELIPASTLNDEEHFRYTFDQIADLLEEKYLNDNSE